MLRSGSKQLKTICNIKPAIHAYTNWVYFKAIQREGEKTTLLFTVWGQMFKKLIILEVFKAFN